MSLETAGGSDSATKDVGIITAAPLTMWCRFRSTDAAASQVLMALLDKDNDTDYFRIVAAGDGAGDPINVRTASSSAGGSANTSTGYSANSWHTAGGVFAAANDRRAFIDGGSKGTNTTSVTPSGIDRMCLAQQVDLTPDRPLIGRIAEAAIWNVALTDAEVALLEKCSPLDIRRANLKGYWPALQRDGSVVLDRSGNRNDLTLNGTPTWANHPPIAPRRIWHVPLLVVAGALTVNQATETDLAQAVTARKTRAVGQIAETGAAQPITPVKLRAVGQVIQTNLAQAVARIKARAVGQISESDLTQPVSRLKTKTLGQIAAAELAQSVGRVKSRTVGQITEADLAQVLGRTKRRVVTQVTQTDFAQTVNRSKTVSLTQAIEIDFAQLIGRAKAREVAQAFELDLAQAVLQPGVLPEIIRLTAIALARPDLALQAAGAFGAGAFGDGPFGIGTQSTIGVSLPRVGDVAVTVPAVDSIVMETVY